jgi:hypothetical protein
MKKPVKIILGILFIATLTSISLYRKYLKKQVLIEQQAKERKVALDYFYKQKELKIKEQEAERLRLLDSVGKAKSDQLKAGMEQLRKARLKIEKEIQESK